MKEIAKYVLLIGSGVGAVVVMVLLLMLCLLYYIFFQTGWEECFEPLQCYSQLCEGKETPVEIKRIDINNNRSVLLYYMDCKWWYERSVPIYYKVVEADKVIIPLTYIEFYDLNYIKQLTFTVIYAEGQSLVGIYDPNKPLTIVVNFQSMEAWPDHSSVTLGNLVERLQHENTGVIIPGFRPTATPKFTSTPAKPTPTSTLVVEPTYYTPRAQSYTNP